MKDVPDIKAFLDHEDALLRIFAAEYYTKSYAEDPELMPAMMASMDRFGLDAFRHAIVDFHRLPQSAESLSWLLAKLEHNRGDVNSRWRLNVLLAKLPLALLVPRLSELRGIRGVRKETIRTIEQRQKLSEWTTDALWQELVVFCEASQGKYVNEMDWGHGTRLVAQLGHRQDLDEELVRDGLRQDDEAAGYLEIYCTMLAGQREMEDAVPLLIDKVAIDSDVICEEGVQALIRIGSEAMLDQVAARFAEESDHFQLYASGVFCHVRSPKAGECANRLLDVVEDSGAQTHLIEALCLSLDDDHLGTAYDLILRGEYDAFLHDLREPLYCAARIAGKDFPELAQWREEIAERDRQVAERLQELTHGGMQSTKAAVKPPKVGRNEPCPCGSGKKYKKCCLR